jgi:hypothetical protein
LMIKTKSSIFYSSNEADEQIAKQFCLDSLVGAMIYNYYTLK